ncbi:uncharacterized protein TNCV_1458021 [Trichonephila clavipes]|nr:uncharacterized protein TNCV_1458021 [Trichonephila clavipes]
MVLPQMYAKSFWKLDVRQHPDQKVISNSENDGKRLAWAKKYRSWTVNNWKEVTFSDEVHLFGQGSKSSAVRRSVDETLLPDRIQPTVKHSSKEMFWGFFTTNGIGRLVPLKGRMNSVKHRNIMQ